MKEEHRRHALDVADAIEANAGLYDQYRYAHDCGTPACVAGWSVAVKAKGAEPAGGADLRALGYDAYARADEIRRQAARNLGLTEEQGREMCLPNPYTGREADGVRRAEPADAVAMLRRYADTGRIVWV